MTTISRTNPVALLSDPARVRALPAALSKGTSKGTSKDTGPQKTAHASQPATRHSAKPATYHIKRGDTLSGLARQHGTTVQAFMKANPQIKNADLIYAGRTLTLPPGAGAPQARGQQPAHQTSRTATSGHASRTKTGPTLPPNHSAKKAASHGGKPKTPASNVFTGKYVVYSSGAHRVRMMSNPSQLLPHHDYQSDRVMGQRLPCYDLVLQKNGSQSCKVPSPVTGEVVFAGRAGGYGKMVVVKDANGNLVRMGHLDSIGVRKGQDVAYGSSVGVQGSTGHSTGEHVHLSASNGVTRRWVQDLMDGHFNGRRG